MTQLIVETTAQEECPCELTNSGADLVYFMSFAAMERMGATHELSELAGILKRRYCISLTPLLAFTDAAAETEADRHMLDRIWQDATRLADTCWLIVDALSQDDARVQEIIASFPDLPAQFEELARIADWAAARGAQVRLTYSL